MILALSASMPLRRTSVTTAANTASKAANSPHRTMFFTPMVPSVSRV